MNYLAALQEWIHGYRDGPAVDDAVEHDGERGCVGHHHAHPVARRDARVRQQRCDARGPGLELREGHLQVVTAQGDAVRVAIHRRNEAGAQAGHGVPYFRNREMTEVGGPPEELLRVVASQPRNHSMFQSFGTIRRDSVNPLRMHQVGCGRSAPPASPARSPTRPGSPWTAECAGPPARPSDAGPGRHSAARRLA